MVEQIKNQKEKIRKDYRKLRMGLGQDACHLLSTAISTKITNWEIFKNSMIVLVYMPIKAEVDLQSLLRQHPEKYWVLPRILPGDEHILRVHPYIPGRLICHQFGMAEPEADLPEIPLSRIELALVPGLAFDRNGWRLGYGGGYYDRFLKDFTGIRTGITYGDLLVESLPHDENDVQMNWVITEKELFRVDSSLQP
jgi:5-formyltetrahydrofolate cyclo-ligase